MIIALRAGGGVAHEKKPLATMRSSNARYGLYLDESRHIWRRLYSHSQADTALLPVFYPLVGLFGPVFCVFTPIFAGIIPSQRLLWQFE